MTTKLNFNLFPLPAEDSYSPIVKKQLVDRHAISEEVIQNGCSFIATSGVIGGVGLIAKGFGVAFNPNYIFKMAGYLGVPAVSYGLGLQYGLSLESSQLSAGEQIASLFMIAGAVGIASSLFLGTSATWTLGVIPLRILGLSTLTGGFGMWQGVQDHFEKKQAFNCGPRNCA